MKSPDEWLDDLENERDKLLVENARLRAENKEAKTVIRDLLESYLASFGGNRDELVARANRVLGR